LLVYAALLQHAPRHHGFPKKRIFFLRHPLVFGIRSAAMQKRHWVFGLLFGLSACTTFVGVQPLPEPPLTEGCNPLGGGEKEDCLLPFPSDVYRKQDAQGAHRLAFPPNALPASTKGVGLDAAQFAGRDGFSPATPLLAFFPQRLDPQNLPKPSRLEDSLKLTSPVQLLDAETGQRIPLFAELDRNAADSDRQALIIHPAVRLLPKRRYVVALLGLLGQDGKELPPLSGFSAIKTGDVQSGTVRAQLADRYKTLFAFLERQGIAKKPLQLAWDFTTGDDEQITGPLLSMRDQALAQLGPPKPPKPGDPPEPGVPLFKIEQVNSTPREPLLRQVIGTFRTTVFLAEGEYGRLLWDETGKPKARGFGPARLVVHVPKCAQTATGPLPVMVYGHGLFGSALGEMDSGYERELIGKLCMVQVGTDWIGLSEADQGFVAGQVMADFNRLGQITDRLMQAQVNVAVLARLVASGALGEVPELKVGGKSVLDAKRVFYYGISNGGIQGLTFLAQSPDVLRGALCVPGGFWSLMMWRSSNFQRLLPLLSANYSDALDRQVLIAFSQMMWDTTDPATYAPHVVSAPLPGSGGAKRVLYQEGLGDAQVPNLATQKMVRTMGIPLLREPVETPWGIPIAGGPIPSGYVQFDIGQTPRPGDDNIPPKDNPVHGAIRWLLPAQQQLERFLTDGGVVVDTCAGKPCRFPRP
jgi:hypothetical protein